MLLKDLSCLHHYNRISLLPQLLRHLAPHARCIDEDQAEMLCGLRRCLARESWREGRVPVWQVEPVGQVSRLFPFRYALADDIKVSGIIYPATLALERVRGKRHP